MKTIEHNIKAHSHPSHYMLHKYWGRKPHNVVREYILNYTKPNDIVLDPFMGSGVTVIEALKHKRKAIGIDLNPISCFITKNTINPIDLSDFDKEFSSLYNRNLKKYSFLYQTHCPNCKSIAYFDNSIWKDENLLRIRGSCEKCGKFIKDADDFDIKTFKNAQTIFNKISKKIKSFYPREKVLQFVKRNGKAYLNELFSERALLILSALIKDINNVKNKETRDLLLLSFTSMLPNVSKMIPGDMDTVNGKSGWVISKLWSPKIHTEKNIFNSFKQRYEKIRKGKEEIFNLIDHRQAQILNISSEKIDKVKKESVDYVFTDPPYGDSIAYFGLSMFWNAWLKNKVDYEGEIIYDQYRNKKYDDYQMRMEKVFKELYRLLKDKRFMSFTFNNRNLNIWKAVMDSVRSAGFHLSNIVYQEQAVSSGTQGINRKNTLRGDFVYNFYKDANKAQKPTKYKDNVEKMIISQVSKWIDEKFGGITSDKLYEKLIPLIVENNAYSDANGKVIDIEVLLKNNFKYGKFKSSYAWQKK